MVEEPCCFSKIPKLPGHFGLVVRSHLLWRAFWTKNGGLATGCGPCGKESDWWGMFPQEIAARNAGERILFWDFLQTSCTWGIWVCPYARSWKTRTLTSSRRGQAERASDLWWLQCSMWIFSEEHVTLFLHVSSKYWSEVNLSEVSSKACWSLEPPKKTWILKNKRLRWLRRLKSWNCWCWMMFDFFQILSFPHENSGYLLHRPFSWLSLVAQWRFGIPRCCRGSWVYCSLGYHFCNQIISSSISCCY